MQPSPLSKFYSRSLPSSPKGNPIPMSNPSHFLPQSLAAANWLSVSVDLPVLGISYQWNHM